MGECGPRHCRCGAAGPSAACHARLSMPMVGMAVHARGETCSCRGAQVPCQSRLVTSFSPTIGGVRAVILFCLARWWKHWWGARDEWAARPLWAAGAVQRVSQIWWRESCGLAGRGLWLTLPSGRGRWGSQAMPTAVGRGRPRCQHVYSFLFLTDALLSGDCFPRWAGWRLV